MKRKVNNFIPYFLYSVTLFGIILNFTVLPSISQKNVEEFQFFTSKIRTNLREINSNLSSYIENHNPDIRLYVNCSLDNFSQYNNDILTLTACLTSDSLISIKDYKNLFNEFKTLCLNNSFFKSRSGLNIVLTRYDDHYKEIEILNDRIRKN